MSLDGRWHWLRDTSSGLSLVLVLVPGVGYQSVNYLIFTY